VPPDAPPAAVLEQPVLEGYMGYRGRGTGEGVGIGGGIGGGRGIGVGIGVGICVYAYIPYSTMFIVYIIFSHCVGAAWA
jgi:hypothetical protein